MFSLRRVEYLLIVHAFSRVKVLISTDPDHLLTINGSHCLCCGVFALTHLECLHGMIAFNTYVVGAHFGRS